MAIIGVKMYKITILLNIYINLSSSSEAAADTKVGQKNEETLPSLYTAASESVSCPMNHNFQTKVLNRCHKQVWKS